MRYHYASIFVNCYLVVKYALLYLLEQEVLLPVSYKFLSCFLLGRYMLYVRAAGKLSKIFTPYVAMQNIRWEVEMLYYRGQFVLPCIEFLMIDRRNIIEFRERFHKRRDSMAVYDIFYFSKTDINANKKFYPRLNRTNEARSNLEENFKRLLYSRLLMAFINTCLLAYAHVSLWFTQLGFEINYKPCIEWIFSARREASNVDFYSYIYPPRPLDYELSISNSSQIPQEIISPISELVSFNWFQYLRLLCDFAETIFVTLSTLMVLLFAGVISALISDDLSWYCDEIRFRMINLVTKLQNSIIMQENKGNCGKLAAVQINASELDREIERVQAFCEDYFKLIGTYNKFANIVSWRYVFVWVTFTTLTFGYLYGYNANKSQGSTNLSVTSYETYILQVVFASISLPLVYALARAGSKSRQLYRLMSSCMALDLKGSKARRLKWIKLMLFYYPRPLNAFTIKGRAISWLFAFQFVAWFISVLFVMWTLNFLLS